MAPRGAGELRDVIRIRRKSKSPDGAGGKVFTWVDVVPRAAAKLTPRVARATGAEEVIAARLTGVAVFDCWIRWSRAAAEITPDDMAQDVRNEKRVFNVRFCQDMDGERKWLLLQLVEGYAVG